MKGELTSIREEYKDPHEKHKKKAEKAHGSEAKMMVTNIERKITKTRNKI